MLVAPRSTDDSGDLSEDGGRWEDGGHVNKAEEGREVAEQAR